MYKVHIYHLRSYSKRRGGNHPFGTIGAVYHPRTGLIHVTSVLFHSSSKHFVKTEARRQVIRKLFNDASGMRLKLPVGIPSLENLMHPNCFTRITDKKAAQKNFEGILADAAKDAQHAKLVKDGEKRAQECLYQLEHGCAP